MQVKIKTAIFTITVAIMVTTIIILWLTNYLSIDDLFSTNKRPSPPQFQSVEYWYSKDQVAQGDLVFQQHCSSCHLADASGSKKWRKRDANGNLPPPPLNGNAHTWHHALSVLQTTIKNGGGEWGGTMPPFSNTLNEEEILSIIAWFQSKWPDEVYIAWSEINSRTGN